MDRDDPVHAASDGFQLCGWTKYYPPEDPVRRIGKRLRLTAGLLARGSVHLATFPGLRPVVSWPFARRLQLRGQLRGIHRIPIEPSCEGPSSQPISDRVCSVNRKAHVMPISPTSSLARLTLVLGGARSGKSVYAERLVTASPAPWLYIATAQGLDGEMASRIAAHQGRRGSAWETVGAPLGLVGALRAVPMGQAVLVDCLTLWLSNVMLSGRDVPAAIDELVDGLMAIGGPCVMVSNEVGLGIVPDNALARAFRDEAGRLNQRVATCADRVVFVAAGLPMVLKG